MTVSERDAELSKKILEEKMANAGMVFISSDWPMSAEQYDMVSQIGAGMANNKVWMVKCLARNNEPVAVKEIDLSQQGADEREKITREVQGMSIVTASPFVVKFHCSFVDRDSLWIVMELMEGSLKDVLKWKYPRGFDNEVAIATIIRETARGLAFLHNNTPKFIHRDVKAGNLLYDKEGVVKLADFGVSAVLASHDEKRVTMAGTWHWMSPEVIDPAAFGGYDERADVWSLGITALELAYGIAPYGDIAPNQVVLYILQNPPPTLDNPRTPHDGKKKWTTNFHLFIKTCLQSEPKKRPAVLKLLKQKWFDSVPKENAAFLKPFLIENMPPADQRFAQRMKTKVENLRLDKKKSLPDMKVARSSTSKSDASKGGEKSRKSLTDDEPELSPRSKAHLRAQSSPKPDLAKKKVEAPKRSDTEGDREKPAEKVEKSKNEVKKERRKSDPRKQDKVEKVDKEDGNGQSKAAKKASRYDNEDDEDDELIED